MRSFACSRVSVSVVSVVIVPLRTRKTLIRPANGSAIVLNTNAAMFAPSTSNGASRSSGPGTPSTSRSRSAVVPRFFVATAAATGKTSPRATAFFSAVATSSSESSWPSR